MTNFSKLSPVRAFYNRTHNTGKYFDKICDRLEGYRAKIVEAEGNGTVFADDHVVGQLKSMVTKNIIKLKAIRDAMRQYPQLKLRKKTMEQLTHIIRTARHLLERIDRLNLNNAADPKLVELPGYGTEFDITEEHRLFPGGKVKPR